MTEQVVAGQVPARLLVSWIRSLLYKLARTDDYVTSFSFRTLDPCQMVSRLLALMVVIVAVPHRGLAADPLNTVRVFCRADGDGVRLRPRTWSSIAPLVTWHLEPAWDRVRLISAYELTTPTISGEGVEVEVRYAVIAEIRAGSVRRDERFETETYRLSLDESNNSWRILGPPPVPYVFSNYADAEAIAALLDPHEPAYVSASALVWELLREAGWDVPYTDTASLPSAAGWLPVQTPQAGDLVIYYDGERPYHVGLVESENQIVSATLNAGVRRAPLAAFAGDVRYWRLQIDTPTPFSPPEAAGAPSGGRPTDEPVPTPVPETPQDAVPIPTPGAPVG